MALIAHLHLSPFFGQIGCTFSHVYQAFLNNLLVTVFVAELQFVNTQALHFIAIYL